MNTYGLTIRRSALLPALNWMGDCFTLNSLTCFTLPAKSMDDVFEAIRRQVQINPAYFDRVIGITMRFRNIFALVIGLLCSLGCGKPPMLSVSGTVKLDGKSVPNCKVGFFPDTETFNPDRHGFGFGVTDDEGRFEIQHPQEHDNRRWQRLVVHCDRSLHASNLRTVWTATN